MAQDKDFFDKYKDILPDTLSVPVAVGVPKKIATNNPVSLEKMGGSRHDEQPRNFDKNNTMVEIEFPDDLPADMAAVFLTLVGAVPIAPTNDKSFAGADYTNGYILAANKRAAEDFINKYQTLEDLHGDPVLIKFYSALIKCKSKIRLNPWSNQKSADFIDILKESYAVNRAIFDRFKFLPNTIIPIHDKINFLYSLCSDNFRIGRLSPTNARKEEIFKHFILMAIDKIKNAPTAIEQEALLDKFMHSIVIEKTILGRKWNEFYYTSLGKLKFSKPLSMMVVLDDGSHVDFFSLDKDKPYRIMNHINVAKINQFVDFSNIDVDGCFDCTRAKSPIVFPKSVNDILDCSYCNSDLITPETRLPDGARIIDFTCTVKSFADLKKLNLPTSLKEILVAKSLISSVLKNADKLAEFQEFAAKYPDIKIAAGPTEKSLQDMLAQAQSEKNEKQVEPKIEQHVVKKQPVIPAKTAEWLTRKEVLSVINQDEQFSTIVGLDRLIKRAINSSAVIKAENRMLDDGSVASCVHVDCIPTIKETVLQIIEEDSKRAKPKEKIVEKQEKTVKQQTKKQVQSVRIKKYIPKQIWKDICNSCGNSLQLLHSVLNDINKINNNYDTQTSTDAPIQYIDTNGNWQCIPNTEFKSGKAATQWIEKKDNRRIVWTINSGVMVAIAFFEDHTNNAKAIINYREALANAKKGLLMDGKTAVDKTLVKSPDFLDVSDLLKQCKPAKADKKVETETKPEVKQHVKTVKQTKTEPKPVVVEPVAEPVAKPAVRAKRPRIKTTQVDVKSLEAEIAVFIEGLDDKIKTLSIRMGKQKNNPEKQLETLKEIEHYIQEKINLQRG